MYILFIFVYFIFNIRNFSHIVFIFEFISLALKCTSCTLASFSLLSQIIFYLYTLTLVKPPVMSVIAKKISQKRIDFRYT